MGFTTGGTDNGYTLQDITAVFGKKFGSPGAITVALHASDGGGPAATPLTLLSGSSSPATAGTYDYRCVGNGCDLDPNTTYFVVMTAPDTSGGTTSTPGRPPPRTTSPSTRPRGRPRPAAGPSPTSERASSTRAPGTMIPGSYTWLLRVTTSVRTSAAPTSLGVVPGEKRGVGYLAITWDAAPGATAYDIRAKEAGASDWHFVARKVTGTSYRYTTDKAIDQVAVRALSADSVGPWVEISRSLTPPDDFMNTYTGPGAGLRRLRLRHGRVASGFASIASASATPPQLPGSPIRFNAPTFVKIERFTHRFKGRINVTFTGDNSRDQIKGENFVCSDTAGWAWHLCGWVDVTDGNKIKYTSVPFAYNLLAPPAWWSSSATGRGAESPHARGTTN